MIDHHVVGRFEIMTRLRIAKLELKFYGWRRPWKALRNAVWVLWRPIVTIGEVE